MLRIERGPAPQVGGLAVSPGRDDHQDHKGKDNQPGEGPAQEDGRLWDHACMSAAADAEVNPSADFLTRS